MTFKFEWDEQNNPVGQSIDQLLYRIRKNDQDGMIYDTVDLAAVLQDSDGVIGVFDALVTPYSRLERKLGQLQMVMDRAVGGIKTVSMQKSVPFKQNGNVQVAAVYELTDGQTVTVMFHNPDANPKQLAASDEMISWKWMLNKKDITIVVAPESGSDLAIREVGRRIMMLAQKNSAAFARINKNRAARLENIANLESECEGLAAHLQGLENEIKAEQDAQEQRALELANTPLSKQFYDALLSQGWAVNGTHEDMLAQSITSYGQDAKVTLDFDGFKDNKVQFIATNSSFSKQDVITLTESMSDNKLALNVLLKTLVSEVNINATMGTLTDLLKTYGFKVQPTDEPESVNVTTPRVGYNIDIELDADGEFIFESNEIVLNHLNYESNVGLIVKKLDELDFVHSINDFDDDPELPDNVIQGGVFKGKGYDFAYAIEQIELAVNAMPDLTVAFGDFNYTAQAGGLFDSVLSESNPPIVGITAQIGYTPTNVILARVELDEKGAAIVYRGEGGTTKEADRSPPVDAGWFKTIFGNLVAELNVEPTLEDTLPELKAYLDQFTPLKRGQILKSLSRAAYDTDGARVTVAQNVISFANHVGAKVITNSEGKTLSDGKFNLSSKLGRIPLNFGVWLLESGTVKPPLPEDFDPRTAEGYATVVQNNDLETYQDQLDSFFQTRLIDVRSALRDLGWTGEQYKDLFKGGVKLSTVFQHAGAGGNLVGVTYRLSTGFEVKDMLDLSAQDLAQKIDSEVPAPAEPEPMPIGLESNPLDVSMANKKNAIQLAENLKEFASKDWLMSKTLEDVKNLNDDQFRELYQADVAALQAEWDQVIAAFNTLYRAAMVKDRGTIQAIADETNAIYKLLSPKSKQLNTAWQALGAEYTAYQKSLNADPAPTNTGNADMEFLNQVIANPESYTGDESMQRLNQLVEATDGDETSELGQKVDQAVTAVQEVVFNQLKNMVTQG